MSIEAFIHSQTWKEGISKVRVKDEPAAERREKTSTPSSKRKRWSLKLVRKRKKKAWNDIHRGGAA